MTPLIFAALVISPQPAARVKKAAPPPQGRVVMQQPLVISAPPVQGRVVVSQPPEAPSASIIEAHAGARSVSRQITTTDDLFGRYAGYTLRVAPAVAGNVEVYPIANKGWISGLGVVASGSYAFVLRATMYDVAGGLIFRHRFGPVTPFVQVRAEGSVLTFQEETQALSLRYWFLEPTLGLHAEIAPWLGISLQARYLAVLSSGSLGETFKRATAHGLDASLHATFLLGAGFSLRAGGYFRRVGFDFHAQPGDHAIAGGAVDQSFGGELALGFTR